MNKGVMSLGIDLELFHNAEVWKEPVFTLCAFVLPMIIAIAFYAVLPDSLRSEEATDFKSFYAPVAEGLVEGKGFYLDSKPATRYPPGYPLILAGIFRIEQHTSLSRSILLRIMVPFSYGIASVFLYLLARYFKDPGSALLTCVVWAVYPPWLWMTKQSNSEIPYVVFFYAGIWLLWRGLNQKKTRELLLLLSGAFIGGSALIRPAAVGLSLVLPFFALWYLSKETPAQRLKNAVLVFIGFCVVILPWQVWLSRNVNGFALLSTGGTPSIRDGLTFAEAPKDYRQRIDMPEDVKLFMHRALERQQSGDLSTLHDIISFLHLEVKRDLVTVTKLYVVKAARSWYATDSGHYENLILLSQIPFLALVTIGVFANSRSPNFSSGLIVLVLGVILYFWIMTILVLSIVRYMLPAIGLSFILIPEVEYFKHLLKLDRQR